MRASRLLTHTCTVVQAGSQASYGHTMPDWSTGTTETKDIPCRLMPTTEYDHATGALISTHALLLDYDSAPASLLVHGAESTHRIAAVTWAVDESDLDAGPFDIREIKDAGGAGRFLTLRLLRVG